MHERHLVGAFNTYSNRTIGLRGTFSADDLRALADALDGKGKNLAGRALRHRKAEGRMP